MKFKFSELKKIAKLRINTGKSKRLRATTRRASQAMIEDYEDEEPTTRFSSALIVMLALHLVLVGGIYAFKSIKTHRVNRDAIVASTIPETSDAAQASAGSDDSVAPREVAGTAPVQQQAVVQTNAGSTPQSHVVRSVKQGENSPAVAASSNTSETKRSVTDVHKSEGAKKAVDTPRANASDKTYTVKKGDNPVRIAHTLNVPYTELLKLNKIDDPRKLQIGTVLKVPPATKKAGN